MLEKDLSHTFTDSVRKKFIELGFPTATSGQLSKIILPFKVDPVEKKVFSRCDNFFYLEQIIKPYHEEIHDIVKKCWGDNFVFEIDNNAEIQIASQNPNTIRINSSVHENTTKLEKEICDSEIHISKFNFKNFIVGESNHDAFNACQFIAKNTGEFSEPVFIHGQTGVGKTHLLHAIGNEIFKKNNQIKIIYVTIHDFINEVIQKGIRLGKMDEVRKKYKFCDVLLVDDIQIIEKKTVCQVEFFHIINTMFQRKKQVIITSNKPPKEFKNLDSRLKSRFFQGAIVEINLPTKNDRTTILKAKTKNLNLNLSKEMIELISSNLKTNTREIEGVLNDILFQSVVLKNSSPSNEMIAGMIQKRLPETSHIQTKKDNLLSLQKTVCRHFDIELSAIKGTNRNKILVLARHLTVYLAKEYLEFKTREIADAFNRKHHKIVFYAVKKIKSLLNTNNEIKTLVDALQKKLY